MAVIKTKYLRVSQQPDSEFSDQCGPSPGTLSLAQGSMSSTEKVKQIESAQLLANSLSCKAACLLGPLVTEQDFFFLQCLLRSGMGCSVDSSEHWACSSCWRKNIFDLQKSILLQAGFSQQQLLATSTYQGASGLKLNACIHFT